MEILGTILEILLSPPALLIFWIIGIILTLMIPIGIWKIHGSINNLTQTLQTQNDILAAILKNQINENSRK